MKRKFEMAMESLGTLDIKCKCKENEDSYLLKYLVSTYMVYGYIAQKKYRQSQECFETSQHILAHFKH